MVLRGDDAWRFLGIGVLWLAVDEGCLLVPSTRLLLASLPSPPARPAWLSLDPSLAALLPQLVPVWTP